MFVTDPTWCEPSIAKRSLIQPLDAWRLVGITSEAPSFLVQCMNLETDNETMVRTFLVGSVELLLKLLDHEPMHKSQPPRVHVIHNAKLEEVRELWEYHAGSDQGQRLFAYTGREGGLKPYYAWQELPRQDSPRIKLAVFANVVPGNQ